VLGVVIQVLLSGFIIGGLARWAVPGPDPMSIPMTILLGIFGSFIGGGIAAAIVGTQQDSGNVFAILIGSILASMLLLIAYRRWVQHRPITGPHAHEQPRERARLGSVLGPPGRHAQASSSDGQADVTEQLRKLAELHDQGALTDEEYEAKKAELVSRL
jgi:uncharacterized membrane protein YeaQ/YmgE (transglycosylase-associated protein family)